MDDIISDSDIINLKKYISDYCNSNYNNYKATGNSGYSTEKVDGSGSNICNGCDTVSNCYKATNNGGGCSAGTFGQIAADGCAGGGAYDGNYCQNQSP